MFMQNTGDSSIWRSLAVAFGDGLAFGVGMKISQSTVRQPAAKAELGSGRLSERIEQLEQQLRQLERIPAAAGTGAFDQKVLEAVVNALEARLQEHAGQVERRLADVEARIALESKALEQQDQTLARRVAQDLAALHEQVVALNREFSEAVGRIIAEQVASQVAAQVEARASASEGRLEARIAAATDQAASRAASQAVVQAVSQAEARSAALERTLEGRVLFVAEQAALKLEALRTSLESEIGANVSGIVDRALAAREDAAEKRYREEMARKDAAIAGLRERMAHLDGSIVDLLGGIGQVCRQAAERIAPPAEGGGEPAAPQAAAPAPEPVPVETPQAESESSEERVPGFAQLERPARLWRVPLVSSMLVALAGCCLVLMRVV